MKTDFYSASQNKSVLILSDKWFMPGIHDIFSPLIKIKSVKIHSIRVIRVLNLFFKRCVQTVTAGRQGWVLICGNQIEVFLHSTNHCLT